MDQEFNSLRLSNESFEAKIQALESELSHTRLSLDENRTLKEQYFDKSESLQKRYQSMLEEFNATRKDVVAIDEIKRDRDERITSLRKNLDETQAHLDNVKRDLSALSVQHEHTISELNRV